VILVAALAGAVRFAYLDGFQQSPFAETPLGESASNVNLAESISAAGTLGEEPYAGPPLYPAMLSVLSGFENELQAYRVAQALAGVILACLVFWGGAMLLGSAAGLLSGVICALYGPLIHMEAQYVPAVPLTLLFVCYWLLCIAASKRESFALLLVAGLVAGAMAGFKTGALVLLVPAVLLVLLGPSFRGHARAAAAVLLLLGAAAATAPFAIHNWRADAPGMLVATNGGTELYKANNIYATGLPPGLAGESSWWRGERYAQTEATVRSGRDLGPGGVSWFWARRAGGYPLSEPVDFLELILRKLGLFWSRHEFDAGPGARFISKNWIPWSTPLMSAFAVLGSLSLAALFLLRKEPNRRLIIFPLTGALVMALVYTAPSSARLLALPSLALLSSALILGLADAIRGGRLTRAGLALAAVAVCALAVNLVAPWLAGVSPSEASGQRLLGVVYEIQGKGSLALSQYDRAKAMAPRNAACRMSLGAMLASDGVADEAERQFLTAAALDTLSPTPHLGLANLYRRNGLLEQSLASLQAAIQRAPYDVGLAISLGRSCVEMGLYEQAEMYFRGALEIDPENISAIDGLIELRERGMHVRVSEKTAGSTETIRDKIQTAMGLLREGQLEQSRQVLDEALEDSPDDLDIVFADATWHLAAGNVDKAIEGYEKCYERNRLNTIVMNNLAAAYQRAGRSDEAVKMWRRVLELDPSNAKARANLRRAEAEEGGE
jgi:tetratricopeptide (TPR) repeat protein